MTTIKNHPGRPGGVNSNGGGWDEGVFKQIGNVRHNGGSWIGSVKLWILVDRGTNGRRLPIIITFIIIIPSSSSSPSSSWQENKWKTTAFHLKENRSLFGASLVPSSHFSCWNLRYDTNINTNIYSIHLCIHLNCTMNYLVISSDQLSLISTIVNHSYWSWLLSTDATFRL